MRIVAAQLDKAMLLIPTSVATNAATSGLSVMYDEVHRAKTVYLRRNPDCILVDTEFVIQGSPRMLAAGIGDSLATYFEARNNWLANNINTVMPGYRQTLCGKSIAEACVETLLKNGESAYCAVRTVCARRNLRIPSRLLTYSVVWVGKTTVAPSLTR